MNRDATWCHETTLTAEPVSPSKARAFVSQHLAEHHFPDLIDPIQLVASELTTHSLVHARCPFTVALWQKDDTVLLAVEEQCSSPPRPTAPGSTATHDPGLAIVDNVSQGWGVDASVAGHKSVWACFDEQ